MTSAADQFGPTGYDHTILRRYDVQPLALIVANLKKDAFAGRAAGFSGHQGFDDTRQMLWQLATIGSALSSSLLACFGVGTILRRFESSDRSIQVLHQAPTLMLRVS
jgi:hypothetical protein